MRQLKKIFLAPATLFFINSCGSSGNGNLDGMPVYPPAPPPPFRYEIQPTKLFSNPEADFTCLTNVKDPSKDFPTEIKCWGDNSHAQINGSGAVSESASLTTVVGLPKILIDPETGKTVYMNEKTGYYGDDPTLGDPFLLNIMQVSVGKNHVCVSLRDESIWCWGDNTFGQITGNINFVSKKDSDGDEIKVADTNPLAATPVGQNVFPYGNVVNALASGNAHTCVAFADAENSIWCWGDNTAGQVTGNGVASRITLEDGTVSNAYPFINVSRNSSLPKGANDVVIALGAGHDFTCALYEHRANLPIEAQTVWCWGSNSAGQVTGEMNTAMPTKGNKFATKATQVLGLPTNKILSLSVGESHACVNMADGNIWCWGSDQNAQVSGIKHTTSISPGLTLVQGIPNGIMEKGESNVLALTTGGNFSCANFKTLGDDLWCWGDNQNGVIDGAGMQGAFAQRITRLSTVHESVVLAGGAHHICTSFTDGAVKCWGDDSKGQVRGTGVLGKAFERITQLTMN